MDELADLLQVGRTLRIFYGTGNRNNATIHIRAIVDDDQIVIREWSRHKQRWLYRVEDTYRFELLYQNGRLSRKK